MQVEDIIRIMKQNPNMPLPEIADMSGWSVTELEILAS